MTLTEKEQKDYFDWFGILAEHFNRGRLSKEYRCQYLLSMLEEGFSVAQFVAVAKRIFAKDDVELTPGNFPSIAKMRALWREIDPPAPTGDSEPLRLDEMGDSDRVQMLDAIARARNIATHPPDWLVSAMGDEERRIALLTRNMTTQERTDFVAHYRTFALRGNQFAYSVAGASDFDPAAVEQMIVDMKTGALTPPSSSTPSSPMSSLANVLSQ